VTLGLKLEMMIECPIPREGPAPDTIVGAAVPGPEAMITVGTGGASVTVVDRLQTRVLIFPALPPPPPPPTSIRRDPRLSCTDRAFDEED